MPCFDPLAEQDSNRENARKVNDLTRMLCTIMGQLERAGIAKDYGSTEIHYWWKAHQEQDRKRMEEEKRRREAERRKDEAEFERLRKKLGIR